MREKEPIFRVWNIERADFDYTLECFEYVFEYYSSTGMKWNEIFTSEDKVWADKTANHYHIKIKDKK